MNRPAIKQDIKDIVVDEVFPHSPDIIWKALTSGDLIGRWLMQPTGFEAVVGNRFTYQTTPAGAWDGTIRCRVIEANPGHSLVYAWTGGDAANIGYGSPLDTVVSWTLEPTAGGTRVRLVHSGFITPLNDTAYTNMSEGWSKVLPRLRSVADEAN